jgi:hypothetical protein
MTDVAAAVLADDNERSTVWLRFNPNAYTVGGYKARTPKKERYRQLIELIQNPVMGKPDQKALSVHHLFYDLCADGRTPVLCLEPDFPDSLRSLVHGVLTETKPLHPCL